MHSGSHNSDNIDLAGDEDFYNAFCGAGIFGGASFYNYTVNNQFLPLYAMCRYTEQYMWQARHSGDQHIRVGYSNPKAGQFLGHRGDNRKVGNVGTTNANASTSSSTSTSEYVNLNGNTKEEKEEKEGKEEKNSADENEKKNPNPNFVPVPSTLDLQRSLVFSIYRDLELDNNSQDQLHKIFVLNADTRKVYTCASHLTYMMPCVDYYNPDIGGLDQDHEGNRNNENTNTNKETNKETNEETIERERGIEILARECSGSKFRVKRCVCPYVCPSGLYDKCTVCVYMCVCVFMYSCMCVLVLHCFWIHHTQCTLLFLLCFVVKAQATSLTTN